MAPSIKTADRTRILFASVWLGILVLAVSLLVALHIGGHRRSLASHHLDHISEHVHESSMTQWRSLARARLSHSDRVGIREAESELESHINEFRKYHHSRSEAFQLHRSVDSYKRESNRLVSLFDRELVAVARSQGAQSLFERDTQLTAQILATKSSVYENGIRQGLIGTWLSAAALLVGMVLTALVAKRMERHERNLERAEAERMAAQEGIRQFCSLVRDADDIIMLLDVNGNVQLASGSLPGKLGLTAVPQNASELLDRMDLDTLTTSLECIKNGEPTTTAQWEIPVDGEPRMFEASFANLLHDPGLQGILVTLRDVTMRQVFEAQLIHQAQHDPLTGLPNRLRFMDELERCLDACRRRHRPTAVMFVDIDHFKVINDSLGHPAGDEILRTIAERLRAAVRPDDFVARLSGDEFTVLLRHVHSEQDALVVGQRMLKMVQAPVTILGRSVFPSVSVGLVMGEQERSASDLLRKADLAMYRAKSTGRNRVTAYTPDMDSEALERLELEAELRRSLREQHFRLHYQPIVDLRTGRVTGMEALARWQHPERGPISPSKFIPIAEETGLILDLGGWVLVEGCRQLREWQLRYPSARNLTLNINVSTLQLVSGDLFAQVQDSLSAVGLDSRHLKLEITESIMMHQLDSHLEKLRQLRDFGVKIAVDDFGTGYSSMSYLTQLPIDTLKIDRSFVMRMNESPNDETVVRSIIGLSKSLGLKVTSEGVETQEQRDRLVILGCDEGQGWFFHRDLAADRFEQLLLDEPLRRAA